MDTDKQTSVDHAVPSNECALEVRNRRRGPDRRKFDHPDFKGPERRRFARRRLSDEIESLFVRLGYFLCRHHIKALAAVLVIVALFADMFATLTHIQRFGFFTGVTILVALLADFVAAPALMVVLTRQTARGRKTEVGLLVGSKEYGEAEVLNVISRYIRQDLQDIQDKKMNHENTKSKKCEIFGIIFRGFCLS